MRIISGFFKGKKLLLPNDKFTRPLKDLTKESIFNLINHSKLFKNSQMVTKATHCWLELLKCWHHKSSSKNLKFATNTNNCDMRYDFF